MPAATERGMKGRVGSVSIAPNAVQVIKELDVAAWTKYVAKQSLD